ncbi:alpha/beta fold hydrolase [Lipingzhangella sp. LS1_29]|uniref:Alpha/beta fold hydrolase n=1 Tax=Lipingzhangella rawalii TaxID=2055835 RepID=A0ABU2HAJ2_9ACTN|nr:alpha/beta fold hydrolase [Lipingzhangella rawalii]MDS1272268.1 alpha/beta fold hydrolase [Lipingzhangella rawalii]
MALVGSQLRARARSLYQAMRTVPRYRALTLTERLSAFTHLFSSLEYLSQPQDRRWGGLNNWDETRATFAAKSRSFTRLVDLWSTPRATTAVHALRVAAATAVLLSSRRDIRATANLTLTTTSVLLYPRHLHGTDGSDQVSFIAQTSATIARLGEHRPAIVDAALWFSALQAVLSYTVSGWVKVVSPSWGEGRALDGVMRTYTYGDPTVWRMLRRYPRLSSYLGHGVRAFECAAPVVFWRNGALTPAFAAGAVAFHIANARVMGLNRFLWAFASLQPALLYATGPPQRLDAAGHPEHRDDTLPRTVAGLGLATAAALATARIQWARTVSRGYGTERFVQTRRGNTLAYRHTGASQPGRPLVVFEHGLVATSVHWEWIAHHLTPDVETLAYDRAGYGRSRLARDWDGLDTAVDDLCDLVDQVRPSGPVVLVGHSLGGYLALRAASRMQDTVCGVGLVDTSHPAELDRSEGQRRGAEGFTRTMDAFPTSLRFGLGALLERPDWVDRLPPAVRRLALAQYRDPGMWQAGAREWASVREDFAHSHGKLPHIHAPLAVFTAGRTRAVDPVQQELHDEIAAAAPWAHRHLVDNTDHDRILTEHDTARQVAEHLRAFLDALAEQREHTS